MEMIYPQVEWVEQDPMKIFHDSVRCIDEAVKKIEKLGRKASDVVCFGVTNQRETTILWDPKTGKPLYNAIGKSSPKSIPINFNIVRSQCDFIIFKVWMDNRTTVTMDQLLSKKEDKSVDQLRSLCGLPLSPYFSALKYRWLVDTVPEVTQAIRQNRCLFGTVDTWLIWVFKILNVKPQNLMIHFRELTTNCEFRI